MATDPRAPLIERTFRRSNAPGADAWIQETNLALFKLNPLPDVTEWFTYFDRVPPPLPTDINLLTWTWGKPGLYLNKVPTNQYDWPLTPPPRARDILLQTWTNENPKLYKNPIPDQQEWFYFDVPPGLKQPALDWVRGMPLTLQPVVAGPMPFNQFDWPQVPLRLARPALDTISGNNPNIYQAANAYILISGDWSLPDPLKPPALGWTYFNPNLYPTSAAQIPFFQTDWPVPPSRPLAATGWVNQNPNLYTNKIPFNQYDWPQVPQGRARPAESWTAGRPELYTNPVPFNQFDWPVPPPRAYPLPLGTFVFAYTPYLPIIVVTITGSDFFFVGLDMNPMDMNLGSSIGLSS